MGKRSYRRRSGAQNPDIVFYVVWSLSQGEFRDIPPLGHLVVVVTVVTDVGLVCVRIRRISGTKVQARLHGSAAGIKSVTIL